jgi:TolB protein
MKIRSSKILYISFLLSLIIISCKEDTIEPELTGFIQGTVIDETSGLVIPNVLITTSPATSSILTDESGKFFLENISVGTYTITASKIGYHRTFVNISVKSDETTQANILMEPGNDNSSAPSLPTNPSPEDKATDISINPTLSWYQNNNIKSDTLKFSVQLFNPNTTEETLLARDITDTLLAVKDLDYNTNYRWQVIVKNSNDETTNGEVWTFKTRSFPDNPYYFSSDISGNYEIYSSDGTDENTVKLTNDSYGEYNPRINPYKNLIAFSSNKDLDFNIYTMNLEGKEQTKITQIPIAGFNNSGTGFNWSPDGQYIIYPNYDKLYKVSYTGGIGNVIAQAPYNYNFREASFNSTGNKIISLIMGQNFYNSEIYLMNSDGSGMQQLVENLPGALGSPSFSPNGKYFIYTYDADGYEDLTNRQMNTHIFMVSLDTLGTPYDLSKNKPNGTNDLEPRFSPDGSKIIFTNCKNTGEEYSIWIMDVSGNNRIKIADKARMPDWK